MYYAYARDPQMRAISDRVAWLRCWITIAGRSSFEQYCLPPLAVPSFIMEMKSGWATTFTCDRNGVRTDALDPLIVMPAFPRPTLSKLFLPVVADAVYGYQAVNTTPENATHSLLN